MTVTLKSIHKAVVVQWHQFNEHPSDVATDWTIQGAEASISVKLHDGTIQEKRVVKNTGSANLFFPLNYSGSVTVTITGSHSGEETGTLSIS